MVCLALEKSIAGLALMLQFRDGRSSLNAPKKCCSWYAYQLQLSAFELAPQFAELATAEKKIQPAAIPSLIHLIPMDTSSHFVFCFFMICREIMGEWE